MHRKHADSERRCRLVSEGRRGDGPVVYWMSRDQRVHDNWALLQAQQEAAVRGTGLLVVCFLDDYHHAASGQFPFMLAGLKGIRERLREHNIGFLAIGQRSEGEMASFLQRVDAHALILDFNPLRKTRRSIERLAGEKTPPIFEVDAHNIVPAWTVSEKKEYGAYTIRPKIGRLLDDYLTEPPSLVIHPFTWTEVSIPDQWRRIPDAPLPVHGTASQLVAGEDAALRGAHAFVRSGLARYATDRNDPCAQAQSGLSPYLHFGHLAAQRLALMVRTSGQPAEITEPFLEELIVRRELADNFCYYEPDYDRFSGFPEWARRTLDEHRGDRREYLYSLGELEAGETHELLWNACQTDLVENGKLHGYLRMYWAKKILEWTEDPESALEYAITLNDRYSLDGCDPNGYTGVAWSIGGVHDRAWRERPVFGKIRYMNEAGCRRKFDTAAYIRSILG
jgi:deoxyribodipyrimidine photo-lyase